MKSESIPAALLTTNYFIQMIYSHIINENLKTQNLTNLVNNYKITKYIYVCH